MMCFRSNRRKGHYCAGLPRFCCQRLEMQCHRWRWKWKWKWRLMALVFALNLFHLTRLYIFYDDKSCDGECCDNIGSVCEKCEPIDVVYTWVNGSDPFLLQSMRKYSKLEGLFAEDDLSPSRFDDKQELKYSLRSLEKYAPWVRQIFIVTAGQLPSWLNLQDGLTEGGKSKLKLISHEDIIPKEFLPTFSSPAIECFLHKIPGLSERFLYFNDDIFLGDFLYLNDLYTTSDGYIVYTAWSVPECSQGCPWSFLGDNSCDQSCNNIECDHDGGDCSRNSKLNNRYVESHVNYPGDYADDPFFDEDDKTDYNDGKENFEKYPGLKEPAQQMDNGRLLQHLITHQDKPKINVMRKLNFITDNNFNTTSDRIIFRQLKNVQAVVTSHKNVSAVFKDLNSNQLIENSTNLSSQIVKNTNNKSKTNKISDVLKTKEVRNISNIILNFNNDIMKNNKNIKKRNTLHNEDNKEINHQSQSDIRRLDVYARSLIYTNKIFNKMYGFQNRKVPAHIPFLMEKKIIEEMQSKFAVEVELTKKNKFRRPNDFQFAFSYYHYMMSERQLFTIDEIFDKFDTDKSGTWSDREIRTVLARVRGLPLTADAVHALETVVRGCESDEHKSHPTPPNERYLDSDMPTLTKKLVAECPGLKNPLIGALGQQKLRALPRPATTVATFAMLSSNITKAVLALDEIRRDTKKFICINDNLDTEHEAEGEIVRMVLQELYEALLPIPSQWELPPHIANRFLRLEELIAWQSSRTIVSRVLIACAMLIMFLTLHQTPYLKWLCSKIKINPFHS